MTSPNEVPEDEVPIEATKTHVYEVRVTVPQSATLPPDDDMAEALRATVGQYVSTALPEEAVRMSASYDEI